MKSNKRGIARILAAFIYSLEGFKAAFKHEEAFRQEMMLFLFLLPLLFFLDVPFALKLALLSANFLVLIVELLNSAVEAVVDLVSPDYNHLAKRAKDMGSGAVFISLLLASMLWGYAIITSLISG